MRTAVRENPAAATFVVVSLTVLFIGGALTYGMRFPVESSVRREAVRNVTEVVRPRMLKIVGSQDLVQPLSGARYEEVDRMVRDYVAGSDIVRLKLWNPDGTVVYSTLPIQIGDSYPGNEGVQRALRGQTSWKVTAETESAQEGATLGEMLEVYLPLSGEPKGQPLGVLEAYMPYAPYSRLLEAIRNSVLAAVAVASVALGTALYLLYAVASREVRRERDRATQRQREVEGLNRLLQRDLAHYFDLQQRILHLRDEVVQQLPAPEETVPSARDAWLVMQIREVADFAANVLGTPEEPGGGNR